MCFLHCQNIALIYLFVKKVGELKQKMLENALERFSEDVFQFVTGETKIWKTLLVKKHTENLNTVGDFSFPNTVQAWQDFLNLEQLSGSAVQDLMSCVGKTLENLVDESINWSLQIQKAIEDKARVHMFLFRPKALQVGLLEATKNIDLISLKMQENTCPVVCDPLCDNMTCVTSLRLKYLTKSIQNLYAISIEPNEKAPKVFITAKSSSKRVRSKIILCGTVLNAKTGAKETQINADDFIRIRQQEMALIAQHKYGVRVATDSKWKEFIAHLGESAVIFELLQVKPSNTVKINFDCSSAGSSKGAAFILYNCARLETIIRTFNTKVEEGIYPALPDFTEIDFSLLTHEDEWGLIFNYVLGLPSLLTNCVGADQHYEFRPHLICGFLCSMVGLISQYYRKIRVLTEPRKHLLPVMFARIYMLKVLNDTLKTCLRILSIKSVSQM